MKNRFHVDLVMQNILSKIHFENFLHFKYKNKCYTEHTHTHTP